MLSRIRRILSYIKPTRQPDFKHPWRQVAEMLIYLLFWPLSPIEYQAYKFGRKGIGPRQMRQYLRNTHATKVLRPRLNDPQWAPLLGNKLLFNSYYSQRGLPVSTIYGMFHPLFGSDIDGKPLRTARDLADWVAEKGITQFVVKPLAGTGGSAVLVLEAVDSPGSNPVFRDSGGQRYTIDELAKHMSQVLDFKNQGFILEERLIGHPDLARFNPSSVNTCRIVTLVSRDGQAEILYAALRIGGTGKNTDNWHSEGIGASIDKETGIIGEGMIRPEFGGTIHTSHPGTGVTFTGEKIPDWPDIAQLAIKAAKITPFIHSVGWDIAATPNGPVIIEGNGQWAPFIIQAVHGGILTPENREKFAHFGLRFP